MIESWFCEFSVCSFLNCRDIFKGEYFTCFGRFLEPYELCDGDGLSHRFPTNGSLPFLFFRIVGTNPYCGFGIRKCQPVGDRFNGSKYDDKLSTLSSFLRPLTLIPFTFTVIHLRSSLLSGRSNVTIVASAKSLKA